MLEEVVEARVEAGVRRGEQLPDQFQVILRDDLRILFAVEGEHGALDGRNRRRRIEVQEIGPPGLCLFRGPHVDARGSFGRNGGNTGHFHLAQGLADQGAVAAFRHAGQRDDEVWTDACPLGIARQQERDGAAFAVADDADLVEAPLAQEEDGRRRVIGKIGRRGL